MHPKKTFTQTQIDNIMELNKTMIQDDIAKIYDCSRRHLSKVINVNKPKKEFTFDNGNGFFCIDKYSKII
jgi:hypothetical protein